MGEAEQIAFEFDGAMPRLKCKGGRPHEPEVGLKERKVEVVRDAGSPENHLRLKAEALDAQDMFFAEPKPGCVDSVSAAEQAGFGGGLQHLILLKDLLRDRPAFVESRDGRKKIEGAEIFALKHAT